MTTRATHPVMANLQERSGSCTPAQKSLLDRACGIFEGIAAQMREINGDQHLNDKGKADKSNALARQHRQSFLQVRSKLNEEKTAIQTQRDGLVPRTIDKSDAAAAMIRAEYRSMLRQMGSAEAIAWASSQSDPALIAALWEAPPGLSGLDARSRDTITDAYVERHCAKQLHALAEQSEAVALVEQATNLAQGSIYTAAGMRHQAEFEAWLAE